MYKCFQIAITIINYYRPPCQKSIEYQFEMFLNSTIIYLEQYLSTPLTSFMNHRRPLFSMYVYWYSGHQVSELEIKCSRAKSHRHWENPVPPVLHFSLGHAPAINYQQRTSSNYICIQDPCTTQASSQRNQSTLLWHQIGHTRQPGSNLCERWP